MDKVIVVYWSQTGNTEMMANAIGEGAKEAGKEAVAFALGCPAMGAEVLEEAEMEPFVCDVEKFVGGKSIVLFGSYGWGDGQWMRDWVDRMSAAGANILGNEGIMAHETPDEAVLDECKAVGKQLASL